MNNTVRIVSAGICLSLALTTRIIAGPPFLTDDPEPVDYHHWETYLLTIGDYTGGGYTIEGPAVEVNYGAFPDTQLHLILPLTSVSGGGRPTATGLGDMELGIKYRFVHETDSRPQIGFFPLAELPTGDASRGLGNGQTWFQLPLWIQKSFGPWTTYGGGGAVLNFAPGERNHPYGGWLVQRDFGKHLTLGGELFAQGADTAGDQGFAALNFGGLYKISDHFNLLFSAGHSVAGDRHTLSYFALYWTW